MGMIGNAPYAGVIDTGNILDGTIETSDLKNNAVTYAKMQSVTAGKVLGRDTSGAGVVQELPISVDSSGNVSFAGSNNAITMSLVNSSGANYLKASNGTAEGRFGITGTNLVSIMSISTHDLTFGVDGGVERGRFDTSGNFKFNSGYGSVATAYGCRAWVNFNGTGSNGANQTIRGSGGVTSVYKNSQADYTVNFSFTMPDAAFSTFVSSNGMSNTSGLVSIMAQSYYNNNSTSPKSTTSTRVQGQGTGGGGGGIDFAFVDVSVFR